MSEDIYDLKNFEGYTDFLTLLSRFNYGHIFININRISVDKISNEPVNIYKEKEAFDDVNACNYISVKVFF